MLRRILSTGCFWTYSGARVSIILFQLSSPKCFAPSIPVFRMKILYHHRVGSLDGGEIVHIQELIRALERLGHKVIIVGPVNVMQAGLVRFGPVGGTKWSRLPNALRELTELCYSVLAFFRLSAAYLIHRPDIIYERSSLFFLASAWLKRFISAPLIVEVNAPLTEERDKHGRLKFKKLAAWSERSSWLAADHVLPVSHVLASHVAKAGVPPGRITVIPNAANLEGLSVVSKEEPCPELQGKIVLGFAGFVRNWHRLDQVLHLLERPKAKNLHFLVVGGGPDFKALRNEVEARNLRDRVSFTGPVTRSEISSYIRAFHIALQPGVTKYASPIKLFEYMAHSKAIVAPNQENIREILADGENALLFDPNLEGSLWRAIERLCFDQELRERLGHAARQTVCDQNFTWNFNALRVTEIAVALRSGARDGSKIKKTTDMNF